MTNVELLRVRGASCWRQAMGDSHNHSGAGLRSGDLIGMVERGCLRVNRVWTPNRTTTKEGSGVNFDSHRHNVTVCGLLKVGVGTHSI